MMRQPHHPTKRATDGFTLVEVLVAVAVFSVILLMLSSIIGNTTAAWQNASAKFARENEAQAALESMTLRLQGATLSPYIDYEYLKGNTSSTPDRYTRQSDLHFVSGPAAALLDTPKALGHAVFFIGAFGIHNEPTWDGLSNLANGWGYYLEYTDGSEDVPRFLESPQKRWRFRLKELQIPAEDLLVFAQGFPNEKAKENYRWFRDPVAEGKSHTLAENIVALVIRPLDPDQSQTSGITTRIAPNYVFDSRAYQGAADVATSLHEKTRHQMPPLLEITMVVINESSAEKLAEESENPAIGQGLFESASDFESDLEKLGEELSDLELDWRVFTATVRLKNSDIRFN